MCVPEVWIREDGGAIVVRRDGFQIEVIPIEGIWSAHYYCEDKGGVEMSFGSTIHEAVDNALAKIKGENHV